MGVRAAENAQTGHQRPTVNLPALPGLVLPCYARRRDARQAAPDFPIPYPTTHQKRDSAHCLLATRPPFTAALPCPAHPRPSNGAWPGHSSMHPPAPPAALYGLAERRTRRMTGTRQLHQTSTTRARFNPPDGYNPARVRLVLPACYQMRVFAGRATSGRLHQLGTARD